MLKKIKILFNSIFRFLFCGKKGKREFVNLICNCYGWKLYPNKTAWYKDEEFLSVSSWVECNEKHYTLWNISKSLSNIDKGFTVECGCWKGSSSYHILRATGTIHYIFDSFEGLPKNGKYDNGCFTQGAYKCSLDQVSKNLSLFGSRVQLLKGWIPDRFTEVGHLDFKLVHIDVDLYEPTKKSIEFFWPLMVTGGILVCDDYNSPSCRGAKKAMDDYFGSKIITLSSNQGIVIK